MLTLIISYDLKAQRDYAPLYAAIEALGSASRVMESFWVVKCALDRVQVYNRLEALMGNGDRLVVMSAPTNIVVSDTIDPVAKSMLGETWRTV